MAVLAGRPVEENRKTKQKIQAGIAAALILQAPLLTCCLAATLKKVDKAVSDHYAAEVAQRENASREQR